MKRKYYKEKSENIYIYFFFEFAQESKNSESFGRNAKNYRKLEKGKKKKVRMTNL